MADSETQQAAVSSDGTDIEQDPLVSQETTELSKRQRSRTWKAVNNAIQVKTAELWNDAEALQKLSNDVYDTQQDKVRLKTLIQSLRTALSKYEHVLGELESLYREDKWGDFKEDAQYNRDYSQRKLEYAYSAIKEGTAKLASLSEETASQGSKSSRKTTSSKVSTSSSTARRKAMAEAAAAREQAEFDRAMAEKENQRRMFEAEEDRIREQRRAQYDYDMAVLAANKATAIADARLNAIEQAINEGDPLNIPARYDDHVNSERETEEWVHTHGLVERPVEGSYQPIRMSVHQEDRNGHVIPAVSEKQEASSRTQAFITSPKEERGSIRTEIRHITEELNALLPEYQTIIPTRGFSGYSGYQPPTTRMTGLVERPVEGSYQPIRMSVHQEDRNRHLIPAVSEKPEASSRTQAFITSPKEERGSIRTEIRHVTEELNTLLPEYKTVVPTRGFSGYSGYQPPTTEMTTIAATNQQMVATLARQSLPKCHPDTFEGDATLFHPWRTAFKAMIQDARLAPGQEMNYLRIYTKGEPQRLVDNFRKRQYREPSQGVNELWTELERRFGNAATITRALLDRLSKAAKFEDNARGKLQTFADACADVDSQLAYLPGLACLNYANAIQPIVEKLPAYLLSKWNRKVVRYAEGHQDAYPGFHEFAILIQDQARLKNHPNVLMSGNSRKFEEKWSGETRCGRTSFNHGSGASPRVLKSDTTPIAADVTTSNTTPSTKYCVFHERKGHDLPECKAFDNRTREEKLDWIRKYGLCFRCLSNQHRAKDCETIVKCDKCGTDNHLTLLHVNREEKPRTSYGEELQATCTTICHDRGGLSCSKIVLVDVFSTRRPEHLQRVYAIVDDQSNASMISPELADELGMTGAKEKYFLSTCSGDKQVKYGRRVPGLLVKSSDGKISKLPTLVECSHIPQEKHEIPTPHIARRFSHLRDIADHIPPFDTNAKIQILIGRDAPELTKVRAFKNGPNGAPWAQKLNLGWTISGQVCLDRVGGPIHIVTRRTSIERPTATGNFPIYETVACTNQFRIHETYGENNQRKDIFETSDDDNEVSTSWEDRRFLDIMKQGIHKNDRGNWEMPLPFRSHKVTMPNNRSLAVSRFNGLLRSFKKRPQLEEHYVKFMAKMFERGHAIPVSPEKLPLQQTNSERDADVAGQVWYLPHFGVYHPKKPDQLRVVFDSSAEYHGTSLNKELLTGPHQMNSLLGVLLRFRREEVAVMCDVEQMFHSFHVNTEHRDFLRFLWFKDNDTTKEIVEFHMTVHLFGNGPSPAVATYGLRKTADVGEEQFGSAAKDFVHKNFYVDDGLTSRPTEEETIELVKNTQGMLAAANLRLHKIVSNSISVMEALPAEDRAKDISNLDLRHDVLPTQRSLGVYWDITKDSFVFRVFLPEKPFTRRGVLSIINSVYDPLGSVAPVLLEGKLILRELVMMGDRKLNDTPLGWDDPLPECQMSRWQTWKDALPMLEDVHISRCYHPSQFGPVIRSEIHAFSDASQLSIGTAVYLRLINERNDVNVSLLFGKAKVAPVHTTTIPRLELCAAVLSSQAVKKLLKELNMKIDQVIFYTDSKVVLGYIQNDSRRFYQYVANQVQMIRTISDPDQWKYTDTTQNPADLATRGTAAVNFAETQWLNGPEFLRQTARSSNLGHEDVILDVDDPEVRKQLVVHALNVTTVKELGSERFRRFSEWSSLTRAVANLIVKVRNFKTRENDHVLRNRCPNRNKRRYLPRLPSIAELTQAATVVIKVVQMEEFAADIKLLEETNSNLEPHCRLSKERKKLLRKSHLYRLDPFLDEDGVLRVGGRLRRSQLESAEKHPALLPKRHHLSELVIKHHHSKVHHQGRQITHGAVRQAGFWVISGHGTVAKILGACITCRKARGTMLTQHMADLPVDRMEVTPPFTNVGFDVFGPWIIHTRRLRGGVMNSKRWGLIFTCLSSRAIHIEVLEAMDASAFICALRRFYAIRGPARKLRCDRGTNFVGAKSELDDAVAEMDQERIERYVTEQGCEWVFNPPHASHFGGVWERQISTIRRVLDSMLLEIGRSQLTHELLVTLMAEVTGIVNSRPISTLPSDTDEPQPLSPAMLITMKTRPYASSPGIFVPQDLYARRRWRRSQYLSDQFWIRWKREYLQSLQPRSKWNERQRNLAAGDVVMVREIGAHRSTWPLGRVLEAVPSEDGKVRKVLVAVWREGQRKTYSRPIGELVLVLESEQKYCTN